MAPVRINTNNVEHIGDVQELRKDNLEAVPERVIRDTEERTIVAKFTSQSCTIPVVDLSKLANASKDEFQLELSKLPLSYEESGFIQVINHGINLELLESIEKVAIDLFMLPLEEKQKYPMLTETPQGYGQGFFFPENQKVDWCNMFALEIAPHPIIPPSFSETLEEHSREMHSLCKRLLSLISISRGLNKGKFEDMFVETCPKPDLVLGRIPNSDGNALTMVQQNKGSLHAPNALFINIGDTLEVLTHGRYKSVEHRAVADKEKDRLSVVIFCFNRFLQMTRIGFSACKQAYPYTFHSAINRDPLIGPRQKNKVVIVLGATGTGKSRLSIDLATLFNAEIVNSDKIQIYKGLDIITNKATKEELKGVPHHLLGVMDPDVDFTPLDFRRHALAAVDSIVRRGKLPIIAGGSNSYVKALVNDDIEFRSRYECCILWVDVSLPILHSFVSVRVDEMAKNGFVDEVRAIFDPEADNTVGIRLSIGVPEMDEYLRDELSHDNNEETKQFLLKEALERIKSNTCKLTVKQLQNISRLQTELGWYMHRIDASEVFINREDKNLANKAWEKLVASPSMAIVEQFLCARDNCLTSLTFPNRITTGCISSCPASSPLITPAKR